LGHLKTGLIALLAGSFLSLQSIAGFSSNTVAAQPQGLADGPGIWVNIWNYPTDSEAFCLKLHANGIRNIFIETSSAKTEAIVNPPLLEALIDSAHRYKMRVIAWSFAGLSDPVADADKLIAAAKFRTAKGGKVDAAAADLEKNLQLENVVAYSEKVRQVLGTSYPLIAVVYSPLNHAPDVALIPWKTLDKYYNVIAPMDYWNSKYEKIEPYSYTLETIKQIRKLVGRPDVEIHVIGDGMGTHGDSIGKFFTACHTAAATSASLYPNQKPTEEQLTVLGQYPQFFPVNSRFRLAAYRELCKQGALVLPEQTDPADLISRGEFYRLLVRQIYLTARGNKVQKLVGPTAAEAASNLSVPEAFNILAKVQAIKLPAGTIAKNVTDNDFLAAAISPKEALETSALVLDAKDNIKRAISQQAKPVANTTVLKTISHRVERSFVQPAFAQGELGTNVNSQPLTYLDAAQIVLQTSAGMTAR
jgi:hypothetical protein